MAWAPLQPTPSYRRWEYSLLDLCERAHMSHTGAGDTFSAGELGLAIGALEERLREWTEPTSPYDQAVRRLVHEALYELHEDACRIVALARGGK